MEINSISPVSCKSKYLTPFADSLKLSNNRTLYIKGDEKYLEALVTKMTKCGKEAVIGGYQASGKHPYSAIDKVVFFKKLADNIMGAEKFLNDFFASQHL